MTQDERIEDKIDKLADKLANIDKTLAVNTSSLVEHVRRTNLLEERVEPLEKDVTMIHGALKFIGVVATLAAIAEGVSVTLEYLKGIK